MAGEGYGSINLTRWFLVNNSKVKRKINTKNPTQKERWMNDLFNCMLYDLLMG
jgi:hypothetical protein